MSDDDEDDGRVWTHADAVAAIPGRAERISAGRPQPKPRPAQAEREGWKRPKGPRDAPHPTWVEMERHRVICRQCPWFVELLGASYQQLKAAGQKHRARMREVDAQQEEAQ